MDDLKPFKYQLLPDVIKEEILREIDKLKNTQVTTVEYKLCKECGKKMQVHSRQTRKADEGMTIFYQCDNCGVMKKV
jgi:DNA-directed RNA polymerase subunit M/transcription elongation factor TFIIS